jgi:hypothetical protein
MTADNETMYAQKGIVVRVEVPQEIWAGESRPIYAVLNGKFYDGGQTKTGDVPWTYPIEWQFAEPIWEENTEHGQTTYEPTPPGSAHDAEYTPSAILTGGHRVKTSTSPLYLGDMTSSASDDELTNNDSYPELHAFLLRDDAALGIFGIQTASPRVSNLLRR